MKVRGNERMGTGRAAGERRAIEAAKKAIASPLLEDVSILGAEGILLNITGGRDLALHEVNEASNIVMEAAGEDANVIFGAVIDPTLDGEIIVTVVATGFGHVPPAIRVTERPARAKVANAEDMSSYDEPAWKRREARANWGRGDSNGSSLEVPTFLRKQMD